MTETRVIKGRWITGEHKKENFTEGDVYHIFQQVINRLVDSRFSGKELLRDSQHLDAYIGFSNAGAHLDMLVNPEVTVKPEVNFRTSIVFTGDPSVYSPSEDGSEPTMIKNLKDYLENCSVNVNDNMLY